MRLKTKLFPTLRLALSLLVLLGTASAAMAYTFEVDGIYYDQDYYNGSYYARVTYATTDYNSYSGDIVIPETVTTSMGATFTVREIGSNAFQNCTNLNSVTISNSIVSIGNYAFYGCSSLTELNLPNSLKTIGMYAFYNCTSLVDITFGAQITSIGKSAFYNCSSLSSVILPSSITSIADYAFSSCSGLTDLTINSGTVGNRAFSGCSSLTNVTVGSGVSYFGESAFENCYSLAKVSIEDLAAWCAITFNGFATNPCYFAQHLYLNDNEITDLVIPETVSSIGYFAFHGCSNLTSVTIPNSVTSIGTYAFVGCSGLTNVTCLATTPPSIASYTFETTHYHNASLMVPKGYRDVYMSADYWKNFTTIYELNDVLVVDGIYYNITGDNTAEVTYKDTDFNSYNGDIVIPEAVTLNGVTYSVTAIGDYAFKDCSALTSVTIPNSVTTIGDYAFSGCSGLTNVTIPNSVTAIGNYAFESCSGLTEISIGSGVATIGDYAFSGCSGLTSVTIPNSVTAIGEYAFSECSGLIEVSIGSGVITIGTYAFQDCNKLAKVTIEDIAAWCAISFNGYYSNPLRMAHHLYMGGNEIKDLVIPNSVTAIGDYAFSDCKGLTSVTIPNSVTAIGNNAFSSCTGLTGKLTIPESVTAIGNYAFESCSGLTGQLTIPNSVITIGRNAFSSCKRLTSLTIGNSVTAIGIYAFSGINDSFTGYNGLTRVTCLATTPITLTSEIFYYDTYNNATLVVPKGCKAAYQAAQYWSNFLNIEEMREVFVEDGIYYNITGDNTVEVTYRDEDYNTYSGIVVIPATVTHEGVTYDVTAIGDYAFYNSTELTNVTLANGIITIGKHAFDHCTNLAKINFPYGLQMIDDYGFYYCTKLTSVNLPNTVTYIGYMAFGYSSVSNFVIPNTTPGGGEGGSGSGGSGGGSGSGGSSGGGGCCVGGGCFAGSGLTNVSMANTVDTIGDQAFAECVHLKKVIMGSSTKVVGDKAFYGCDSLVTVICKAVNPPQMSSMNCFTSYSKATLIVPIISLEAYMNTDWWNRFSSIEGTYFATGPDDLNGDGKCDIADVATLVDALLMGIDEEHADYMDVDGDGRTTIADLATLIDMLLRGY